MENKLLSLLLSKKDEALAGAGAQAGLLTSAVKGTISLILSGMKEDVPEGMDTLDYALGLFVKAGFDALEKQPLALTLAETPASQQEVGQSLIKEGAENAVWQQETRVPEHDGTQRAE